MSSSYAKAYNDDDLLKSLNKELTRHFENTVLLSILDPAERDVQLASEASIFFNNRQTPLPSNPHAPSSSIKFKSQLLLMLTSCGRLRLCLEIFALEEVTREDLEDVKETPEEITANFTCQMFETPQDVLKGARHMIIYVRSYTYEHQYNLFLALAMKMSEEPFQLLIVDSIIALFGVDFSGRGELAERQQKLAQMLSRLTKIAKEFNVAVYMTNQGIKHIRRSQ